MFEITSGIVPKAQRIVVYGVEGVGKSTFAAQFPDALFIDTEGSTNHMDVRRLPAPATWQALIAEVQHVRDTPGLCSTLVIDTADWAEKLCMIQICETYEKTGIEDFGWGAGYTYAFDAFGKLLNLLNDVIERGINVVLTAHAMIGKFDTPDEEASYNRYKLKLVDTPKTSISNMVKEWADAVLFCNYKTVVEYVGDDSKNRKAKARGGKTRVMYCTHHACWDAKNRWGLPDELPFEYAQIAPFVPAGTSEPRQRSQATPLPTQPAQQVAPRAEPVAQPVMMPTPALEPAPVPVPVPAPASAPAPAAPALELPEHWEPLRQLMEHDGVTVDEIREVSANAGNYTADTPPDNYDPGYITGFLIPNWAVVVQRVGDNRLKNEPIPFN